MIVEQVNQKANIYQSLSKINKQTLINQRPKDIYICVEKDKAWNLFYDYEPKSEQTIVQIHGTIEHKIGNRKKISPALPFTLSME